jgi:hypothetical protein
MGAKFARNLMSPVPPAAILSLLQAGYPVDLVFRILVHEISCGVAFPGETDPATDSLSPEVRKILGLDPQANEFPVVYGAIPKDDKGIAILTRWILDVLLDLSSDIEVPAVDVEEKRVTPTYVEKGTTGEKIPPLIRVLSSSEKHADAFVSIRYRNSWFRIDDGNFRIKGSHGAAEILGLRPSTLYYRMMRLAIPSSRKKDQY